MTRKFYNLIMPRQNQTDERFIYGTSKIRKRVSSSSSASSSLLQSYRLKRAIMVSEKGASTTAPPKRRMNPKSPSASSKNFESSRRNGPVSARKLASALWELNKIPSPRFSESLSTRRSRKMVRSRPHRLSDPSHSPGSERRDRSRSGSYRRIMPIVSQRVRCKGRNHRALDWLSSSSLMEADAHSRGLTPKRSTMGTKTGLKNLKNILTSSKELLKLLDRIWGLEDHHSYALSLFSALHAELDQARSQVEHLIQEQKVNQNEISCLKKQFKQEKSSWKIKEQERIKTFIEQLESEKKSRRRAERLNKSLGLELAKGVRELESERDSHCIELNMENNKGYVEKLDQHTERYISVKKLRDQMLAGNRVVLPRGLFSPSREFAKD
ncbi:uncharacterized protein A4U43_C09F15400 [Asparagus officinalis]|uniref:Uncharacterized protein n=1 Tax=Asparagus officinalis TaxID=4686 RepID=A0A5P1E7X3_ASPOF|nr:uncharacterized protein At5g41620-like isoform X2 [Asparagus officinalis]ONK58664.1 uncharacterized protein A4U43_C09F15400 [Asparagus officinalis]